MNVSFGVRFIEGWFVLLGMKFKWQPLRDVTGVLEISHMGHEITGDGGGDIGQCSNSCEISF
jgi:hypothetical protein